MSLGLHGIMGILGVTLIVGTYLLLTLDKISSNELTYSVLNALGATLIIISLTVDFNLAALLVEGFWLAISLYGIYRAMLQRQWLTSSSPSPRGRRDS